MHSRNKPEFKHYTKAIKSESKHACNADIITNLESYSTKFVISFKKMPTFPIYISQIKYLDFFL